MTDLRQLAEMLRGHQVAPGVRLIVVPATQRIYREALQEGLIEVFLDAGAMSPPHVRRLALKAAAAGAAVFAALLVLPAPLAVSLGVGAAAYGALLLALRVDRELDLAQVFRRA